MADRNDKAAERAPQVFTLVVEVGRKAGDGLPDAATGAGLLCYASGISEEEAVREAVAVLKLADMAVLTVESHGSRAEIEAAGTVIAPEEAALMDRALSENAVIVAQVSVFED